jgi:hypothetical protein
MARKKLATEPNIDPAARIAGLEETIRTLRSFLTQTQDELSKEQELNNKLTIALANNAKFLSEVVLIREVKNVK